MEHTLIFTQLSIIMASIFYCIFMVYKMERGMKEVIRALDAFTDKVAEFVRKR